MTGQHAALSTQAQYPWKAVARTVLQIVIGLAVSAPLIVAAITGDSAEAAGGALAVFLTVAAAITRLMAVPLVNGWLTTVGLGAAPKPATPPGDPNLTDEYHPADSP
ncbi:hypothetical protein AL755_08445 [Arthrobacter sp. ERGS1:01]|uniref:hypothetical protein n=1 Tax=Arthrobacter sp. ERGS1:01 TaxID=1704044 RepID=UPI0006B519BE|nr:hypothetical protein [Arthrobacter sp. ERGS1:01]ALE05500.1 hypothetical protein AL755_08445 [Arthrobacter sp. ERGS1:01]